MRTGAAPQFQSGGTNITVKKRAEKLCVVPPTFAMGVQQVQKHAESLWDSI